MTDAKRRPNLLWWVVWHTTYDTTRKSMRRDAWLTFLAGALVLVACGAAIYYGRWLPAAWPGFLPGVVLVIVGLWTRAAVSWLDRHQAWDRVPGQPPHPRSSRWGGMIVFLAGLLFLTLAGWRF
jgi:hypothetical protein